MRISRSKRRSRRPAPPGSTASFSPSGQRFSSSGFGAEPLPPGDGLSDRSSRRAGSDQAAGPPRALRARLLNTLRRRELRRGDRKTGGRDRARPGPRPIRRGRPESRASIASASRWRQAGFAMIDDGMGFQLVPWRPALEQQLGRQVSGALLPGGRRRLELWAQPRAWSIATSSSLRRQAVPEPALAVRTLLPEHSRNGPSPE